MTAITRTLNRPVPQSRPLDVRQVKNNAGGYVYEIDLEAAFDRFLILGTAGGTYYASESKLTRDGMALCVRAANELDADVYAKHVTEAARTAPKRTYAIYAIAVALIEGDDDLRHLAPSMAEKVCKTGTDLFELASYIKGQRGWGSTVKNTFDRFLSDMDIDRLGLWAVKYRNRHGWSWNDLLRQQHTKPDSERRDALFSFMTGKLDGPSGIKVIDGYRKVQGVTDEEEIIRLVKEYDLPWEALADEQRTAAVWKAAIPNIGDWAVLRNLATFTRLGLDKDDHAKREILVRLAGASRVHPVTLLEALRTYGGGGRYGRSQGDAFRPLPAWLGAIESTLDRSFTDGVETFHQNVYIGLDVSGSMGSPVSGSYVLTCRDVGAALALGFAKNEPFTEINGFTSAGNWRETGLTRFNWNQQTSFADAVNQTSDLPFGATDCALPMIDATARDLKIDTFIVITDNETWAGKIHPMAALQGYRKHSGVNARLAVIGLTATNFSIADPKDPLTMDFVGFSSDLPKALASFMKMG